MKLQNNIKNLLTFFIFPIMVFISCKKKDFPLVNPKTQNLDSIASNYYEQFLKLYPLEATRQGDNRYNDQLPVNISEEFIAGEIKFYESVEKQLENVDYNQLTDKDKVIYDVLKFTIKDKKERYAYFPQYMPFNQFDGLPLEFPLLGSGSGSQPFKTEKDYENWLSRMEKFPKWMKTAQDNFRLGIQKNIVLPQKLVLKMIPQMRAEEITSTDLSKNIFMGPTRQFPSNFSEEKKLYFTEKFSKMVVDKIIPTYLNMAYFLEKEYLPEARQTDGINAIADGLAAYSYYVKSWTTTDLTPKEIREIGEREVNFLRSEMEKVKQEVGFSGSLEEFLKHLQTDQNAMPYKTSSEVLAAFNGILKKIEPKLKTMFINTPKTPFEIRQTEKFREATASAEYMQGSADGKRPGIFYLPLPDPSLFNITSGMESLFLHEAIPGHHYQIALQQENTNLPKFMRFGWLGAYGEGWAHYCETLGPELGLYQDPYQKMGYLNDQMLRAVRLVVDTGLHTGKMTRDEAVAYYMKNIATDSASAISAIERYMALPGQALGYKIGALKIKELREKYQKELGEKFSLRDFHSEVLSQGCLPLSVLERKMKIWAEKQK